MVEDKSEEITENNILYELLVYTEWPQEPEVQVKNLKDNPEEKYIHYTPRWKKLFPFSSISYPLPIFQALVNVQMPWQFAVGEEGQVVAILQEQSLEIRSFRDEYGSVIGRALVTRDLFPQWRKLLWSPNCTMLALCSSNGNIDVFDLIGAQLFHIPNTVLSKSHGKDFSEAIAGLTFSDLRVKNTEWSYELIVANFKGTIKAYFVSLTDQYKVNHQFSVTSYYPSGITAFCYHRLSHTLLICGQSPNISNIDSSNNALQYGITSWRMLIDRPFYKLSLALEDEKALQRSTWWSYLQWPTGNENSEHTVYKMSISPNDRILATIHTSGMLSLWDLPSLVHKKDLKLELQPNYSERNPQYHENLLKRKMPVLIPESLQFHLHDINWWSDDALILARCSGAISVSSIFSLKNLLGISPEWFEPAAQVSMSYNRGFLAMECESVVTKKKRSASELYDHSDDEEDDSTDEEDLSFFTRCKEMAKTTMFYITDHERFRPPRKKLKFLNKTYRLLCLKSTTPEELFSRKINNEEYGEALVLAKAYNLDSDLVYQRQWRKMPATVSSIQDYLSKITKRAWVLHECLERVPETIEAAKELLLYGLRGTNLTALIAIGKGEDHGRFILGEPFMEDYSEDYYDQYYNFEEADMRRQEIADKKADLLKQVNFTRLTLEQKQLCQCRLKLLNYLDRLTTYEAILGGPGMAEELYDYNFFKKFRSQSGFETCINFAHNSNYQAIAAMFTYHGNETLLHRLSILNNFPETTSPQLYQTILPKLGYFENAVDVSKWTEHTWRNPDWCEIKSDGNPGIIDDFTVEFYDSNKNLLKYRGKLMPNLLSQWFIERAHEIESCSCLVDNALDLIKLGMERNVQGLENLLDDLKTLEVLMYDCQIDENFSLKEFEERDDFEIIGLLMSKSNENNIIKNVKCILLPFLDRCERRSPGSRKTLLKRYLVNTSETGLKMCRKIFENSRNDQSDPIISNTKDQVTIALDCIYNCEKTDSLKDIFVIMELLSYTNKTTDAEIKKLYDQMQDLKKHLRVAELLEKNGMAVTVGFIKNSSENSEEIKKFLTKLTRFAGRRQPDLDKNEWKSLLHDMLEIQKQLFPYLTVDDCYEIYLLSLLCSGKNTTIQLAGTKMETTRKSHREQSTSGLANSSYKLPFDKSVNLILKAAQEYFNSSANVNDPCLEFSKNCLDLIKDDSLSIQEELDLISAVKSLKEFHIDSLPLQVRLCSDRLIFIQQCLNNNKGVHRQSKILMDIAYKLRICGKNVKEREGKVLSLIAEAAFSEKDYNSCMKACQQLIEGGHQEGWSICYKLGNCNQFSEIKSKCELMSFSLIHCSYELLEEILKAKAKLQFQIVCERVQFLMGEDFHFDFDNRNDNTQSESSENPKTDSDLSTLQQTKEKTLQVLQHTTETTKAVLSAVGDAGFWKQTIKWIKPRVLTWETTASDNKCQKNSSLRLQGTCAFYSGLIDNAHISTIECNYQRYARPDVSPSIEVSTCLFQASLLEDFIKGDWSKSNFNNAVITDLATSYLPEEIDIAFAYLMCLRNLDDFDAFFNKFPNTPIVLYFASFCLAFKICVRAGILNFSPIEKCDLVDIPAIIRQADEFMNSNDASDLKSDSEIQQEFNLLAKYNKMLYDFIQAEILHSIGGGVDAVRFTSDDVYKKDTILGIAMTADDRVFDIAVSLAHRYKLSLFDVYIAQLEYLFSESSIPTNVIENKISNLRQLLLKDHETFKEKLEQCIWPNINGKDHSKLHQYFVLLELCGDEMNHSKLLKKFSASVKHLDYKLLMSPGASSLQYLFSILNESNVHVFAKSASKIPSEKGFLSSSSVYCMWAKKYFFEGDSVRQKVPQTVSDWIHRYEACNDIIQRLSSADFLKFINHVAFSEKSLQRLTLNCRSEIIKRALKFCKQKNTKSKEEPGAITEWSVNISSLQKYQHHLQRMDDPILVQLRNSTNPQVIAYVQEFDLSQSAIEMLQKLLVKVVIEGPDLSLLTMLLSCCPLEIEWDRSTAYIEGINFVIDKIRNGEEEYTMTFKRGYLIKILENILFDISKNRDDLLIDDLIIDILYGFCQDATVPVAKRLQILQILEKTNYFIEDYSNLLLLYQTQTVVTSIWPEYEKAEKLTEDDVKDELQRYSLFGKLITSSTTLDHFISLAELLCHWPSFTSLYDEKSDDNTPWATVLCHLALLPDKTGLNYIINFFDKAHAKGSLSPQACFKIFQEIVKQGSLLHILKFAFKTIYEEIHNSAINILKQTDLVTDNDYDEELLELILKRHQVVQILPTNLYKPVIEFLLNKQEENQMEDHYSVDAIIKELFEANYKVEAGSLLNIFNQTHRGLATYSSAFNVIHRWLTK